MKILIDPIFTNDPHFCVMTFKMQQIVKHLLAVRPDVMFYHLLPLPTPIDKGNSDWVVDPDWLVQDPRVLYIGLQCYRDRMREYQRVPPELTKGLAHNGSLWDVDLILTCRSARVGQMRISQNTPQLKALPLRRLVIVDDMPVLSCKEFVWQSNPKYQDMETLLGYLASDAVYFVNFWEKDWAYHLVRKYFAGSIVREAQNLLKPSSPVQYQRRDINVKSEQFVRETAQQERPFTVGYTQRWEKTHRKSQDIVDLMEKHWQYRGGKHRMRFMITSNSKGGAGMKLFDAMELVRLPREKFWECMREDMSVIIVLASEDGYSLSVLEPMVLGVPVILQRAPWSEAMFGPDYPFFVSGETQAYGMVKAFFHDYAGMYEKFAQWQQGPFADLLIKRNEMFLPLQIEKEMETLDRLSEAYYTRVRASCNSVTEAMLEDIPDEFVFEERMGELVNQGKINRRITQEKRLTFVKMERFHIRSELKAFGFDDASPELGHLRRITK